jgi:hypothetical protein
MTKKKSGKKNIGLYKKLPTAAAVKNKSPGIKSPAIFICEICLMLQGFLVIHPASDPGYRCRRNPDKKFFGRWSRHWFHPVQQPAPSSRIPDILSGARP